MLMREAPGPSRMAAIATSLSEGLPVVRADLEPYAARANAEIDDPACHSDRLRRAASLLVSLYELRRSEGEEALAVTALATARRGVARSLACDPLQPNLWLLLARLRAVSDGLGPDVLATLKVSYRLGRYEGWIARRRFAFAVGMLPVVDPELRAWLREEGLLLLSGPYWREVLATYFSSPAFAQEFIDGLLPVLAEADRERFSDNRDYLRHGRFRRSGAT